MTTPAATVPQQRPSPPTATEGEDVYVVIRGRVTGHPHGPGCAIVLSYGDTGRVLAVETGERGVLVIPAAAACALAVCLP